MAILVIDLETKIFNSVEKLAIYQISPNWLALLSDASQMVYSKEVTNCSMPR
jgi:hypothetical protein